MARAIHMQAPKVTWLCPQLSHSPEQAMSDALEATRDWPAASSTVIGSSLGGFYARWLGLRQGWRRVLLNPAAHPARDLARHLGTQTAWHDPETRFDFEQTHVEALEAMEHEILEWSPARPATPEQQMAIITEGDEVLDWREMEAFCAGGHTVRLAGGDHAISNFADHLPSVMKFVRPRLDGA
ncbi:hypothetical protein NBRC116584_12730 [Hydrogenophaga sp. 5NK40-0174]